jgi:AcrR family transcriptional regulator
MYRTGIETKLTILETAKSLFYQRGYKAVTVHEICDGAGVKLGTFTYYFSRKDDLIGAIYNSYMTACKDYVDANAPAGLSPAEHHMFAVMLYYSRLYQDEHIIAFHREVLKLGSESAYFENPRAVLADFSDDCAIDRNDPTYGLMVMADNAVRGALNVDFASQDSHSLADVRQLLTDIYTITARLFGTNREALLAYIDSAYRFVQCHESADVSLLR